MTTELSNPSEESELQRRKLRNHALLVWVLSIVLIRGIFELQRVVPWVRQNSALLTAMVLLYLPLAILWRKKQRVTYFEDSWGEFARSILIFIVVSLAIFPLLEVGNRFFQDWFLHRHYVGGHYQKLGQVVFFQLVLVALPEEFFYRGYLQEQMNQVYTKRFNFLGAEFGMGAIVTALIFALSHSLIHMQWWHFAIFFPALVFGWLRERTGKITASILFHALSNIYSYWVAMNYFSGSR